MATTYDAIIIGTGQAGPFLARRLTASGMKVAIIERKQFGGTCVNTVVFLRKQWSQAPMPPGWPRVRASSEWLPAV